MRPATRQALRVAGLDPDEVARLINTALDEDLHGGEDVTAAATIVPGTITTGDYVVRRPGVIAGLAVLAASLEIGLGDAADYELKLIDGDQVARGDVVATVTAPSMALLTIERTSLNLLCRISGVATATRRWVDALAGTQAKVRDTRKTTPGMRHLDKYAVRSGGGVNHRIGLYDAVLIKDNHVVAAGGVANALDAVHRYLGGRAMVIQCEIDRLSQLNDALTHGATEILLDNMSIADMTEAVSRARTSHPHVKIEASGGLELANAGDVARTGVDYLAVGALTHSSPILDIALDARI